MLHPVVDRASVSQGVAGRPRRFKSRRLQIGGGLAFAIIVPWLIIAIVGTGPADHEIVRNSLIANGSAVLVGFYIYHSMAAYPGTQKGYFILPTFSIAFAIVIMALLFSRIDYNRIILLSGFLGSISWYYATALLPDSRGMLRAGVVPFGDVEFCHDVGNVRWQFLAAPDLAHMGACDLLVADFHAHLPEEWERFIADATLSGVSVFDLKQLRESLTGRVRIDHLSENNFGSLIPAHAYLRIKQVGDFATALVALVVLLPLLLVVALLIRAESSGPVMFRQKRVGYGGRVFVVYKFRTMRHERIDPSDRMQAMTGEDDPRITGIGRFLRRTRIDELPQLINILRGEMSWIGPRPEALILSQWYENEIPFYRYRHVVRPGITGWAQVNQGHVAGVDEVFGKLQYDFYYIRYFSPWLDALIVVRTFLTLGSGFGAK